METSVPECDCGATELQRLARFRSEHVKPFASIDVSELAAWVTAIPFESWPQQKRLADGVLRPAMVNDISWHYFGERTDKLVGKLVDELMSEMGELLRQFQRMLSVVMPGHDIPPHSDKQIPEWLYRVHIPLVTNPDAMFIVKDVPYHLEVGTAYLVNVKARHEIVNRGSTPRIHFMFDVMKQ